MTRVRSSRSATGVRDDPVEAASGSEADDLASPIAALAGQSPSTLDRLSGGVSGEGQRDKGSDASTEASSFRDSTPSGRTVAKTANRIPNRLPVGKPVNVCAPDLLEHPFTVRAGCPVFRAWLLPATGVVGGASKAGAVGMGRTVIGLPALHQLGHMRGKRGTNLQAKAASHPTTTLRELMTDARAEATTSWLTDVLRPAGRAQGRLATYPARYPVVYPVPEIFPAQSTDATRTSVFIRSRPAAVDQAAQRPGEQFVIEDDALDRAPTPGHCCGTSHRTVIPGIVRGSTVQRLPCGIIGGPDLRGGRSAT